MKKILLIAGTTLSSLFAHAQKDPGVDAVVPKDASEPKSIVAKYIATYSELAMQEMIRTGVPACITLAQGILETQAGQSDLVKASNNHFGIKCKTEWTGAKVYHDDDEKGECFRGYPSAADSYRDHSDFLKNRPNYAFLFLLDPSDYQGWARGLKKAGYATSPVYPQMLIKIINDNNLQKYSLLALDRQKHHRNEPAREALALLSDLPKETAPERSMTKASEKQTIREPLAVMPATNVAAKEDGPSISAAAQNAVAETGQAAVQDPEASAYPTGTFRVNAREAVYASAGTSLFALANRYHLAYRKLLEFNELDGNADILDKGRVVYLDRKPKQPVRKGK